MADLNNFSGTGRFVKTPELKETTSGSKLTSFTLAVSRGYKDKNTGETPTDWIDCLAWGNIAEFICKYFRQGDKCAVAGELQTRKYEVDGQNRKATEVNLQKITFCGSPANRKPETTVTEFEADDDLPF